MERWLPVVGYEGLYEISDLGRVKSLDRKSKSGAKVTGRFLKLTTNQSGYSVVSLHGHVGRTQGKVHRLVLEAFVGLSDSRAEACHFPDPSKTNNRLDNLRWGSAKENAGDRDKHGRTNKPRGENNPVAKLSDTRVIEIFKARKNGKTQKEIADEFGVSQSLISMVCGRKIWSHVECMP